MSGDWLPPRSCSVIGAAHRRRELPCQDASLACSLIAGNATVQLMAVADGHGSRRYWLSEVGSALACEQARQAVAAALQHTPLTDQVRWRELLRRDLPEAIVQGWLAAISADWQRRPEAAQQAFTPTTYGCTLGLVLMTPRWWGYTGLGDWDLVLLPATGPAQLLSEEELADPGAHSAEATASLCLPQAAALCAGRAALQPLAENGLTLVLSTDGVRKSCATDADFLELCSQLAAIEAAAELADGLAHITSQGSGDDVSVAVGQYRAKGADRTGRSPTPALTAMALLLVTAAAGLGLAGWWWQRRVAAPRSVLPAQPAAVLPEAVRQEIRRQCAQPQLIATNLNQRRPQILRLLQADGRRQAQTWLASAERDPLGALIAASRLGPLPACEALQQELQRQWPPQQRSTPATPPPVRMPAAPPPRPSQQP